MKWNELKYIKHKQLLYLLLLIKAAIMMSLIHSGAIGLSPDEAQYWTWSQKLDWGYYSKPPGIAWQIWLGTQVFGNSELGVRFFSVFFGFLLPITVFHFAKAANLQLRTCFWAALAMAFSPLGMMASLFAITDVGMVLFWSLASIVVVKGLTEKMRLNFFLLGLMILLGALFKWPIYLFWLILLPCLYLYPFLYTRYLFVGILISLLGMLPSVVWNGTHNWATFRHVTTIISGGNSPAVSSVFSGNFFEFLAAQFAIFSPVLFLLLIAVYVLVLRKKSVLTPSLMFCFLSSLPLLVIFSTLSIFQKIQGNWCAFIYPASAVLISWFCCEYLKTKTRYLKWGVSTSILLIALTLSIPFIQSQGVFQEMQLNYRLNPFRHQLGWNRLESILKNSGYDPSEHFLFSDKYQMSSILSFYGPDQKLAYFLNINDNRHNQFSFWPDMSKERIGKTGFYVLSENAPHLKNLEATTEKTKKKLSAYFQDVQVLEKCTLFACYGSPAKCAVVFKCINYNGCLPQNTCKW